MINPFARAFARLRHNRRNLAVLKGLSEHQLADIGLTTADLFRLEQGSR